MYNQRFRQWNISKYLKISDKNEMLKECGGSIKQLEEQAQRGLISRQDFRKTLRWYRATQPSYPSRPMSLDPKIVNPELIYRSLSDYHCWLADSIKRSPEAGDSMLVLEQSRESSDLWLGIIEGVQSLALTKPSLERNHRSFALLRQVGSLAAPAMMSRPFDFISELLVELNSPMNSQWVEIRCIILRLFFQEANRVFSPAHPIAVICREMVKARHMPEVATRSLDCMFDLATKLWGEHSIVAYKIRTASYLAKIKRRDVLSAEKDIAWLLDRALKTWGRDSPQVREVQLRYGLLYILIARLAANVAGTPDTAGAASKALEHLREAAGCPPGDSATASEPVCCEDEIAMQAVADMGVSYKLRGDMDLALVWYRKSAELAIRLCGATSNTSHWAITLLVSTLRSLGKEEEALAWEARRSQPE